MKIFLIICWILTIIIGSACQDKTKNPYLTGFISGTLAVTFLRLALEM